MRAINIDEAWEIAEGTYDIFNMNPNAPKRIVNLPHDAMIETETDPNSPGGTCTAFYNSRVINYNKKIMIPAEWSDEQVYLKFDGSMMNTTVEVNGAKVTLQHYGYAPFLVDITNRVYFGQENRVSIVCNGSTQPNSRWYTGLGIYRELNLVHGPKLHIANDGIYAYTKSIEKNADGSTTATIKLEIEIENHATRDKLLTVEASIFEKGKTDKDALLTRSTKIQVNACSSDKAYMTMTLDNPKLWDVDNPNLYIIKVKTVESGDFITHEVASANPMVDEECVQFGIRSIQWDVRNGLRINGQTVKLKGGCLHHDNGILGAVSLYDVEYRKLAKLKSIGFNAVRTTHNPPSKAFLDACDDIGMYVYDEAFDAWDIAKMAGDYNQYFQSDWKKDITAFMRRDRSRACVIMWSDGNEIPERGGMADGYTMATAVARFAKSLDNTRPMTNAICSYWSGLDDAGMAESMSTLVTQFSTNVQNINTSNKGATFWEDHSITFTNGLDIVGYNYMEDKYSLDHELYPERIILGSENYPKEIGVNWPMVESTPYVIGDFTWTAFDYIGEVGIGKCVYMEEDDPRLAMGPYALSSHTSEYPWRTANDADFDINGNMKPQGAYRSIVWGSDKTHVFSYDPASHGKIEVISQWGFPAVDKCWNWEGYENKPIDVLVFTGGDEVELILNGKSLGRKPVDGVTRSQEMPGAVLFTLTYEPGKLEAIGYKDGVEISRNALETVGAPASLRFVSDDAVLKADGHSTKAVHVEILDADGRLVPTAEIKLEATVEGACSLAGFGSGAMITTDNYTKGACSSFEGRATAILRAGFKSCETTLTVKSDLGTITYTI